jgi:hypothetical protein
LRVLGRVAAMLRIIGLYFLSEFEKDSESK